MAEMVTRLLSTVDVLAQLRGERFNLSISRIRYLIADGQVLAPQQIGKTYLWDEQAVGSLRLACERRGWKTPHGYPMTQPTTRF